MLRGLLPQKGKMVRLEGRLEAAIDMQRFGRMKVGWGPGRTTGSLVEGGATEAESATWGASEMMADCQCTAMFRPICPDLSSAVLQMHVTDRKGNGLHSCAHTHMALLMHRSRPKTCRTCGSCSSSMTGHSMNKIGLGIFLPSANPTAENCSEQCTTEWPQSCAYPCTQMG